MVAPGIVDGHFHGTGTPTATSATGTIVAGSREAQTRSPTVPTRPSKGSNVRLYACNFFAEALTPRGTQLTREDLDRLDTTRPVLLRNADGHQVLAQQPCDRELRIDERTPKPSGSQIGRDAQGRPNGFADMEVEDCGDVAPGA